MKILGYIDDLLSWFFNWQLSIGLWNLLLIPAELIIILFIISLILRYKGNYN